MQNVPALVLSADFSICRKQLATVCRVSAAQKKEAARRRPL